jgi:hypothetical protein
MKKAILISMMLIYAGPLGPTDVTAADVFIPNGFVTGNAYRRLSSAERLAYVMGATDTMMAAPIFGAPESKMRWLSQCLPGMEGEQVRALVDKYLEDNPVKWNFPATALVFSAFREACPGSPRKKSH